MCSVGQCFFPTRTRTKEDNPWLWLKCGRVSGKAPVLMKTSDRQTPCSHIFFFYSCGWFQKCCAFVFLEKNPTPKLAKDFPERQAQGLRWAGAECREQWDHTALKPKYIFMSRIHLQVQISRPSQPSLGKAHRLPGQQGRLNWARICRGPPLNFVYALIVSSLYFFFFVLFSYFLAQSLPLLQSSALCLNNKHFEIEKRFT